MNPPEHILDYTFDILPNGEKYYIVSLIVLKKYLLQELKDIEKIKNSGDENDFSKGQEYAFRMILQTFPKGVK